MNYRILMEDLSNCGKFKLYYKKFPTKGHALLQLEMLLRNKLWNGWGLQVIEIKSSCYEVNFETSSTLTGVL